MTKSTTLPPDITVTRADVLALPNATAYKSPPMPEEGRSWHIERNSQGLAWVDLPTGMPFSQRAMWEDVHKIETARHLTEQEAAIAERAFLWQTALASDAALADIGNDPAPTAPPVVVHGDLIATIRSAIAEETAKAIRHVTDGAKA